jgi:hypothetical protein
MNHTENEMLILTRLLLRRTGEALSNAAPGAREPRFQD